LKQIRGIRTNVFLEVRTEFKPQWRALHAAQRAAEANGIGIAIAAQMLCKPCRRFDLSRHYRVTPALTADDP
jgi:hypothetical protein